MLQTKRPKEQYAHFLEDSWRVFRIISEFVEGFETLTDLGPSVSIFGSARARPDHPYYQLAIDTARKISERGFSIITGGGPGIMEAANKGAQLAHGRSCGLSIDLPFETASNPYIDPSFNLHFRYFFVRKVMFMRYAQAFVVLPGGFGTLDELFEALTLIQTHKIKKFPIFLIGASYWTGLIDWLEQRMVEEGFIAEGDLSLFTVTDNLDEVAQTILSRYEESKNVGNF